MGRFRPCLAIFLLEESLLDLLADAHHPSFGAGRTIAKVCSFGLGLSRSLFSGTYLIRELMGYVHHARAVFLG
jgi:hypothetical protein